MAPISETRKGEALLFFHLILWSSFPIISTLSITYAHALVVFAWSTLFSGLFFAVCMLYRGTWRQMHNRRLWWYLLWVAVFIGVGYYGFYFVGLSGTSAGNAALIAQFEVFTSFMFFQVLRSEYMSWDHIAGALLMIVGGVIILAPNVTHFNYGDILVLCATLCAPVGNFYMQRARVIASSETIMFMRTLLATPIIFLFAYIFTSGAIFDGVYVALPFLIINGVLLLGLSKILWIEIIHRMSVTKASAMNSIGPLITIFFAWIIFGQHPSAVQLASSIPFILGVLLLTDNIRFGSIRSLAI